MEWDVLSIVGGVCCIAGQAVFWSSLIMLFGPPQLIRKIFPRSHEVTVGDMSDEFQVAHSVIQLLR